MREEVQWAYEFDCRAGRLALYRNGKVFSSYSAAATDPKRIVVHISDVLQGILSDDIVNGDNKNIQGLLTMCIELFAELANVALS